MVTLSSSSCSSGFHVTYAQEHIAELSVLIAPVELQLPRVQVCSTTLLCKRRQYLSFIFVWNLLCCETVFFCHPVWLDFQMLLTKSNILKSSLNVNTCKAY